MQTFLIVDGNGLIHRAYHALPEFTTKDGKHTNAVYGFASIMHKTIAELAPAFIAVCFDTKAPTFRDKLYKEYRIQRPEIKEELKSQFPYVKEFLTASGIFNIEKDGLEADDLIGIIATISAKKNLKTIILSGDKDMMQLINETVYVLTPQLGFGKAKLYTSEEVKKTFGVSPEQIADYKALAGDSSDNYKGVTGIGPKGAVMLLNRFKTLEGIYAHIHEIESERMKKSLETFKKNALISKELATILTKDHVGFSIDDAKFEGYNEQLHQFFEKFEFASLESRFFPKQKKTVPAVKKIEDSQDSLF